MSNVHRVFKEEKNQTTTKPTKVFQSLLAHPQGNLFGVCKSQENERVRPHVANKWDGSQCKQKCQIIRNYNSCDSDITINGLFFNLAECCLQEYSPNLKQKNKLNNTLIYSTYKWYNFYCICWQ